MELNLILQSLVTHSLMENKFVWFAGGKCVDMEGLFILVEKIYQAALYECCQKNVLITGSIKYDLSNPF